MKTTRLRIWMRKYGAAGVFMTANVLGLHYLWVRRRPFVIGTGAFSLLLTMSLLWYYRARSPHTHIAPLPDTSLSVSSRHATGISPEHKTLEQRNHALITAIKANDTDAVLTALNAGADANATSKGDAPDSEAFSALQWLFEPISEDKAHPENLQILAELLEKGAHINQATPGQPPLHRAASCGYMDSVRLLLKHGADANLRNEAGATPLFYSEYPCAKLLLAHGAKVNIADNHSTTLLIAAADFGSPRLVRTLLEHGAVPNRQGWYGIGANIRTGTPLQQAVVWERAELIPLLISYGAKINVKDSEGDTALDRARQYKNDDMVRLLKRYGAR